MVEHGQPQIMDPLLLQRFLAESHLMAAGTDKVG
jgi:hypothetical protein